MILYKVVPSSPDIPLPKLGKCIKRLGSRYKVHARRLWVCDTYYYTIHHIVDTHTNIYYRVTLTNRSIFDEIKMIQKQIGYIENLITCAKVNLI
jgi:hypothetical protein